MRHGRAGLGTLKVTRQRPEGAKQDPQGPYSALQAVIGEKFYIRSPRISSSYKKLESMKWTNGQGVAVERCRLELR